MRDFLLSIPSMFIGEPPLTTQRMTFKQEKGKKGEAKILVGMERYVIVPEKVFRELVEIAAKNKPDKGGAEHVKPVSGKIISSRPAKKQPKRNRR